MLFIWLLAVSALLQLLVTLLTWRDAYAFSHRLMWAWYGETPGMTAFWSLAVAAAGIAAARMKWASYLLAAALLGRFGHDLAFAGFGLMQMVWPMVALVIVVNTLAMPSADEKAEPVPHASGDLTFRWTARWRYRFAAMAVVGPLGPLVVLVPMSRMGILPNWLPFAFIGTVLVLIGYVLNFYPSRVEFTDERVIVCHLLGKELHISGSDIESLDLEREISPSMPRGAAIRLANGKTVLIPPFFEGLDELRASLQRMVGGSLSIQTPEGEDA